MSHVLAKLKGVKLADIEKALKEDAKVHANEGLFLEHLWQNDDDENEVLFLFRADDLSHAKHYIKKVHSKALVENPDVNLPQMVFLEGK